MNDNRTYGIEIEMVSKINDYELSLIISPILTAFGHSVETMGYGHNTDGQNYFRWSLKRDGSISPTQKFPHGIELVSPVLIGSEELNILQKVLEAMEPYVNVNRSCGLHVHHGVSASEPLKKMVNAWIDLESQFFKILPESRQENNYCRKYTGNPYIVPVTGRVSLRRWHSRYIGNRYYSLNLESFWLRGTVEFRLHSATVEFEKIKNWVLITQLFVDNSLEGKKVKEKTFQGLLNFLFNKESKKTKRQVALNLLYKGTTPEEMIQVLMDSFPGTTVEKAKTYFAGGIRRAKRNGYVIQKIGAITMAVRPDWAPESQPEADAESLVKYIVERYEHFGYDNRQVA